MAPPTSPAARTSLACHVARGGWVSGARQVQRLTCQAELTVPEGPGGGADTWLDEKSDFSNRVMPQTVGHCGGDKRTGRRARGQTQIRHTERCSDR
eukprot:104073-Rhodomonas_salina.3